MAAQICLVMLASGLAIAMNVVATGILTVHRLRKTPVLLEVGCVLLPEPWGQNPRICAELGGDYRKSGDLGGEVLCVLGPGEGGDPD